MAYLLAVTHFQRITMLPTRAIVMALLAVSCILPASNEAVASGRSCQRRCYPCCYLIPQTAFRVGIDPDDLTIRVVGAAFNSLELYFRDEVRTVTIDSAKNLHCASRIAFAPESNHGAFSVRHGERDDTVQLFAWKIGGPGGAVTLAPSPTVMLKPQTTISVEWITTRTARLHAGATTDQAVIVRFSDADVAWQRFDVTTQSWQPLN